MGWGGWSRRQSAVFLDGRGSWRVQSNPHQATMLRRLPVGTELAVEVLPERRFGGLVVLRHDRSDVAIFYPGRYSRSLHDAVWATRSSGYRLLTQARRIDPGRFSDERDIRPNPADSCLEVRSVLAADLRYWLAHPEEQRDRGFFELQWTKTSRYNDYDDIYQLARTAFLGKDHSRIFQCVLRCQPHSSWGADSAEVFVNGVSIGEVRAGTMDGTDEVIEKIKLGCRWGMARLQWWPKEVSLEVCPANTEGVLPHWPGPFMWRDQRRASRDRRDSR